MGFLDWLRRLTGSGTARGSRPEAPAEPLPAVQRRRDEPTTFIAPPDTVPVPEATEAVSVSEELPVAPEAESAAPPLSDPAAPEPEPAPPAPPPAEATDATTPMAAAPADDPEATRAIEPVRDDPEATLYLELPKRVVATIEAVKGELVGQTFELREGDNQLGRSPESDIVLPSMWISRRHATIQCEGGRMRMVAHSDKITTVDGEPAGDGRDLNDGCRIQLGGTVFELRLES